MVQPGTQVPCSLPCSPLPASTPWSRQRVWGNLRADRVSPHLLSLSCIRDSLLGLAFDLTNCVGSHTASKERKIVSRDSTHLIPHRTVWPTFPGGLGLARVVAEPLCSGAGRGTAGFCSSWPCASIHQHQDSKPRRSWWKAAAISWAAYLHPIRHRFPISCFSQGLLLPPVPNPYPRGYLPSPAAPPQHRSL